jgi:hypothetical protein
MVVAVGDGREVMAMVLCFSNTTQKKNKIERR